MEKRKILAWMNFGIMYVVALIAIIYALMRSENIETQMLILGGFGLVSLFKSLSNADKLDQMAIGDLDAMEEATHL